MPWANTWSTAGGTHWRRCVARPQTGSGPLRVHERKHERVPISRIQFRCPLPLQASFRVP
jgi:hypothetical protein